MSDTGELVNSGGEVYRRRYARVATAMPVGYTREGDAPAKSGHMSDLGGGGIRLATDEDLPLGSVLLLRFRLPASEKDVVARGRIVLSFYNAEDRRFFHGVAFTQIDPRDQAEIVRHVAAEVERIAVEAEAEAAD